MADPIVREIVESVRVQPQHSTFDPSTSQINQEEETPRAQSRQQPKDSVAAETENIETSRAQPQQPPNDSVAAETEDIETPRAQPQQPPNDSEAAETEDIETPRAQPQQPPNDSVAAETEVQTPRIDSALLRAIVNGDLMGFKKILLIQGPTVISVVAYGENTALHVVAGAMKKSSQIPIVKIFFYSLLAVPFFLIGLIPIFLLLCYIIKNKVKKFVSVHFPWIPQKIYEKAKRTRWLRWVLFFHKRRMYQEIAKTIYRQHKSMLNACNYAKETPLHCAANAGNLHMVSLLVKFAREEGPQKLEQVLWATNEVGETALHEAARSGYSDIVKELLRADETVPSSEDDNGISPLYWAVTTGCFDVVQQLIAAEHPPSYAGPDKQNALHAAVMRQKENITRVILEKNSLLAAKADKAGNTPLHYAAFIGNIYAVRKLLLLEDKGPVYKGNSSGSFPVHLAAEGGNFSVIKELLRKCPDVGVLLDREKRNFLHVALHLAVKSSESEIVDLLSRNKRVNRYVYIFMV